MTGGVRAKVDILLRAHQTVVPPGSTLNAQSPCFFVFQISKFAELARDRLGTFPESSPGLRIRSDLGLLDGGACIMGVQTSVIITWLSLRTGIRWKNSQISKGVEIKTEKLKDEIKQRRKGGKSECELKGFRKGG